MCRSLHDFPTDELQGAIPTRSPNINNMELPALASAAPVRSASTVCASALIFGYPALALVLFLIAFVLGGVLVASSLLSDRKPQPKEDRDPI